MTTKDEALKLALDALHARISGSSRATEAEYKAAMYNLQGQFDSVNPYYAINQVQKLEDELH